MAKSRLSGGYCGNAVETGGGDDDSEGSGTSGQIDAGENTVLEDSSVPRRKCISLNSSGNDAFGVPMQVVPMSNLSPARRKELLDRLTSELEQVRVFRKRIEMGRANGVMLSSSGDVLSRSNVHNGDRMERKPSMSGTVSGNELKPLGQNQKPRGWNRGSSGKFESAARTSSLSAANALLMKDCELLLKRLMSHQYGWVFNTPVDVVKLNLPDYFSIIKQPMDLGTIKSKIAAGEYAGPVEFAEDVRLTFSNAMNYNPRGHDVHIMADTLSKYFELRWKTIEKKLPRRDVVQLSSKRDTSEDVKTTRPLLPSKRDTCEDVKSTRPLLPSKRDTCEDVKTSRPLPPSKPDICEGVKTTRPLPPSKPDICEGVKTTRPLPPSKPDTCEGVKTTRPMPPSKKRKTTTSPPQPVVMPPAKRVMSVEEKRNLGRELESLGEMPIHIIDFLQKNCSNGGECEEDELEIDIDVLKDDTLFTLRKLLDDFLLEKQKNDTKVEVCEIEVLNDSAPSNSSLLPFKGNDPDDEEVDIGGNEPPVSSYPPVVIEKDTACRINNCLTLSPGSSDMDSSDSSDSESDDVKSNPANIAKEPENMGSGAQMVENSRTADTSERNRECDPTERKVSPDKLYRAALLKNRFADTILKAREKTLSQGEKGDPEKLRQHREMLEMARRKERARLQTEAKAAEDARKRAEAQAAAESRRKRELEREAARQVLQQMEKSVEINENPRFLEDLVLLSAVPAEQLPSSVDETSPDISQDGMGSFKFGGGNPLERLGLYIKNDDEEEEGDPLCVPNPVNDIEDGEI